MRRRIWIYNWLNSNFSVKKKSALCHDGKLTLARGWRFKSVAKKKEKKKLTIQPQKIKAAIKSRSIEKFNIIYNLVFFFLFIKIIYTLSNVLYSTIGMNYAVSHSWRISHHYSLLFFFYSFHLSGQYLPSYTPAM